MSDNNQNGKRIIKLLASIGAILATGLWSFFFFGFLIVSTIWPETIKESWFLELVRKRPGGTVGVAIAALSAFTIVWVLDIFSAEPIKIELWVLKFEGAAGPVILWILCFLAIVYGGDVLWDKEGV